MSDFKAKMHQIRFPLGEHCSTALPLYAPLAVFKGPTSKGREGEEGMEREEEVGEGKGEEGWPTSWGDGNICHNGRNYF